MVIGTLVESMYMDHYIPFQEADDNEYNSKDLNNATIDGTIDYFEKNAGNIDQTNVTDFNKAIADKYHEYEKSHPSTGILTKWVHKLRMLYNRWLHRANAEKHTGKIGFSKIYSESLPIGLTNS